jgi:hypothetical protein
MILFNLLINHLKIKQVEQSDLMYLKINNLIPNNIEMSIKLWKKMNKMDYIILEKSHQIYIKYLNYEIRVELLLKLKVHSS